MDSLSFSASPLEVGLERAFRFRVAAAQDLLACWWVVGSDWALAPEGVV